MSFKKYIFIYTLITSSFITASEFMIRGIKGQSLGMYNKQNHTAWLHNPITQTTSSYTSVILVQYAEQIMPPNIPGFQKFAILPIQQKVISQEEKPIPKESPTKEEKESQEAKKSNVDLLRKSPLLNEFILWGIPQTSSPVTEQEIIPNLAQRYNIHNLYSSAQPNVPRLNQQANQPRKKRKERKSEDFIKNVKKRNYY